MTSDEVVQEAVDILCRIAGDNAGIVMSDFIVIAATAQTACAGRHVFHLEAEDLINAIGSLAHRIRAHVESGQSVELQ